MFELANQEIIQRPRYIANAFADVFKRARSHLFTNMEQLLEFYKNRQPTNRKVVKLLAANPSNDNQNDIFSHLKQFVKSLSAHDLAMFLKYVTGGDILPNDNIKVVFTEDVPRAPRARTCIPQLELQSSYNCYNELAEEFMNVLKNPEFFVSVYIVCHFVIIVQERLVFNIF